MENITLDKIVIETCKLRYLFLLKTTEECKKTQVSYLIKLLIKYQEEQHYIFGDIKDDIIIDESDYKNLFS